MSSSHHPRLSHWVRVWQASVSQAAAQLARALARAIGDGEGLPLARVVPAAEAAAAELLAVQSRDHDASRSHDILLAVCTLQPACQPMH